jgi:hypothetical protein
MAAIEATTTEKQQRSTTTSNDGHQGRERKQVRQVTFSTHDWWYHYDGDQVQVQQEERQQQALTGAQWRKQHSKKRAKLKRKQERIQKLEENLIRLKVEQQKAIHEVRHQTERLEQQRAEKLRLIRANEEAVRQREEEMQRMQQMEEQQRQQHLQNMQRFDALFMEIHRMNHRDQTRKMMQELKARHEAKQHREAQESEQIQREVLRQIILKAEPQFLKAAQKRWRKRALRRKEMEQRIQAKLQELELDRQHEQYLLRRAIARCWDAPTEKKKKKRYVEASDQSIRLFFKERHIQTIQDYVQSWEIPVSLEMEWKQSLQEQQQLLAAKSRNRQKSMQYQKERQRIKDQQEQEDQRFKQQLQEGHERLLAQRFRHQEALRSQEEEMRRQLKISQTRKHKKKQCKIALTQHRKNSAQTMEINPPNIRPKPDPPVIQLHTTPPAPRQFFMRLPLHRRTIRKKSRLRHPHPVTDHPAQSTPSHRKATRMQPFNTILNRDGGRPSFFPTSYFLPSLSQHHAWFEPTHRKALRQQPFS